MITTINEFKRALNEGTGDNYKSHPMAEHVLTHEEACKIAAAEEQLEMDHRQGPWPDEKFNELADDLTGLTVADCAEILRPDTPQEIFDLILNMLAVSKANESGTNEHQAAKLWDEWTPIQRRTFLQKYFQNTISREALNDIIERDYKDVWNWWDLNLQDVIDKHAAEFASAGHE
jgi:hypothetical protein